jgi:hypothetical protein
MKNIFFIVALISLISQWGSSQVTCPGANFYTQSEVSQYVSNYSGCEVVTGSLSFDYDNIDPITDVSDLSSIIKINGDFQFNGTQIMNISFNVLDSVMGSVNLDQNGDLINFSMNNLKYVQNNISINNFSNNSFDVALPNLTHASHFSLYGINDLNIPLLENTNYIVRV